MPCLSFPAEIFFSTLLHLIDDLRQARVTNIDTDSAGQFVVGYLHNMRMASILSVITNRLDNTWSTDDSSERRACRAACEALHILQQRDRHKSSFRLSFQAEIFFSTLLHLT